MEETKQDILIRLLSGDKTLAELIEETTSGANIVGIPTGLYKGVTQKRKKDKKRKRLRFRKIL